MTNPSTQERLFRLFKELRAKHPYSFAIQQIPLTFTQGELFETLLKDYMTIAFRKGIPSLFTALNQLIYKSKEKMDTVQRTVSLWIKNLEAIGNLEGQKDGEREAPTTLLWAYYFMAQLQDYLLHSELALEYINKAISHTPTLVELYMVKAKIYKHAGAIQKASDAMNDARELDLQDRFVNSKCVKYMLRAGKIAQAENTVSLFTRVRINCYNNSMASNEPLQSESKDPLNDLVEMQCHWYTFEAGKAHMNLKEAGKALKKFHQIEKVR